MKLFEISHEIEQVLSRAIDPESGEILDEGLDELLDTLQVERDRKALDIACVLKGMQAEANALREEAKALTERARVKENQHARLLRYLEEHLPQGEKLEDSRAKIGWRRSDAVEVTDMDLLPEKYRRVKVEPDKLALRDLLRAGEVVEGATLVRRMHLTVR